ncbi:Type II inositol-3,4-bisphosphate 4-phosphatase [Operophtera brumata]|uniref:Type II inositol-3,4-bisphosphate 4-phosphatase n=1 Tax=Operophtera brumata TaxID=104452 RepID=A0A0L7L431_OPEBR|nr:Type II inositol-3,4-bisphosphate 4-phosphatase [Operophtera brumata]
MMGLLIKLLDEAHKWTRMAHTAMRIDSETPVWTLEHATLQSRRDTCFSQALTTATAGLMCWLSSVPGEVVFKTIQSGLGPLCGFEGLLSLYALEKTMWGDMVVAIEDLHTVLFKLVKVSSRHRRLNPGPYQQHLPEELRHRRQWTAPCADQPGHCTSARLPEGSSRSKPLEEVMETLRAAVLRRAPRNVEVLHLAALATRLMHGRNRLLLLFGTLET